MTSPRRSCMSSVPRPTSMRWPSWTTTTPLGTGVDAGLASRRNAPIYENGICIRCGRMKASRGDYTSEAGGERGFCVLLGGRPQREAADPALRRVHHAPTPAPTDVPDLQLAGMD